MRATRYACARLATVFTTALLAACGPVESRPDAPPAPRDAAAADVASPDTAAPPADAPREDVASPDAVAPPGDASAGSCVGPVPLVYNAPTDRAPHRVAPPALGPAGTRVMDPSYGTTILRVTDVSTVAGTNLSYRVANEFWGNDWNTDATRFYLQDSAGAFLLFDFDPRAMRANRTMDRAMPGTPLRMPLAPGGFSRRAPNLFFGIMGLSIQQYDFDTQTRSMVVDLTTIVPGATGYSLGVQEGANGLLATVFGGPSQDRMPYVATYDPASRAHHVVDVTNSTLDGHPIGATIGGGVHTFRLDASGRYLTFSVLGSGVNGTWLWDTTAGTVQQATGLGNVMGWAASMRGGGSGDSYQWQLTRMPDTTMSTPLITPAITPTDTHASSSLSWQNAAPGALPPVIVETMRQPADTGPWRAWDEEVIAVRTDGVLVAGEGGAPQTQVWRFAHTWNTYSGTTYSDNYYYLFIPRVSQNGWFVLYDSNWNQTLGTDASGNARTDAFIVALPNPCGP